MKYLLCLALGLLAVQTVRADNFDSAATSVNQLGLELMRQLAGPKPEGNLLLSPYSIQTALAMTYAGAEGVTRKEMAKVLHYPAEETTLRASLDGLRAGLERAVKNSVDEAADNNRRGDSAEPIKFMVANRLYGQTGYGFNEAFLNGLKDGYQAPLETLDFVTAAEPARLRINGWVEEQTRTRIRDLIPAVGISPTTRLVLVNSLYVKAPWETPFEKSATKDRPFFVGGTQQVDVPIMQSHTRIGYVNRDGFTAVTLPYIGTGYLGGTLQLLVVLPDKKTGLNGILAKLTPQVLHEIATAPYSDALLELPKFRVAGETVDLSLALEALGMKTAFDLPKGSADFGAMAPRRADDYLYFSNVFHKTFVAVDEVGTEAAAATAVVMMVTGGRLRMNPTEVHVDHPFLFAIQHRESGTCLFLGIVNDPR